MSEKSSEKSEMSAADLTVDQLNDLARRGIRDRVRCLVKQAKRNGAEGLERAIEIVDRKLGFGFQRTRSHYYGEARKVTPGEVERVRLILQRSEELEAARNEALAFDKGLARFLPPSLADRARLAGAVFIDDVGGGV